MIKVINSIIDKSENKYEILYNLIIMFISRYKINKNYSTVIVNLNKIYNQLKIQENLLYHHNLYFKESNYFNIENDINFQLDYYILIIRYNSHYENKLYLLANSILMTNFVIISQQNNEIHEFYKNFNKISLILPDFNLIWNRTKYFTNSKIYSRGFNDELNRNLSYNSYVNIDIIDLLEQKLNYINKLEILKDEEFEIYHNLDIENCIKILLNDYMNFLKILNEKTKIKKNQYYEWNFTIILYNTKYSARKSSHLFYFISRALEIFEGVELELTDLGNGSKWANFIITIKDETSRLELIEVFKDILSFGQSVLFRKSLSEIRKEQSEIKKNNLESRLLENELNKQNELELNTKINDLENNIKMLDISIKEEELISLKLKNAKKISSLLKDGILQYDGAVELYLNNIFIVNTTEYKKVDVKNALGLIEGNEKIVSTKN